MKRFITRKNKFILYLTIGLISGTMKVSSEATNSQGSGAFIIRPPLGLLYEGENMENLTGKVFNDLAAIRYVGGGNGSQGSVWLWKCSCGNEAQFPAHRVKKGYTTDCGCVKKKCKHCGKDSDRLNRHGNPSQVCQSCYNAQCNSFKTRNPKSQMIASARMRAKKQGVPCTIAADDFEIPEFCPVLGIKLEAGTQREHEASPSLDKLEPTLGYVPGNVMVVSHRANRLKGDGSADEHQKIAAWMRSQPALVQKMDKTDSEFLEVSA